MAAKQDEAVAFIRRKKNMDLEEFRGVYPTKYGSYQARIWEPRRQAMTYLGSFRTAEEAARAYGAAAVRLHLHGTARDFRQRTVATDDDADAPLLRVSCVDKDAKTDSRSGHDAGTPGRAKKKKTEAWPGAWTEFRGVTRKRSGRYGAQIRDSNGKARCLGTFDTAEEAARAYDAAAVKLHGAAAKTNFKVDDAQARTGFRGVCQQQSGRYNARIWDPAKRARLWLGTYDKAEDAAGAYDAEAVRLHGERAITNFKQTLVDLNDFTELPPPDFFSDSVIPGAQLDDVWTDLPQPELQSVDELLQDMVFTDVGA